jgi:hypothetical protein
VSGRKRKHAPCVLSLGEDDNNQEGGELLFLAEISQGEKKVRRARKRGVGKILKQVQSIF